MPQWQFAFDAAGMATYRALALPAAHPGYPSLAGSEVRGDRTGMPLRLERPLLDARRPLPGTLNPFVLRFAVQ